MKNYLIILVLVFLSLIAYGQNPKNNNPKPKIGVVLSGGGAKGFAHIGVLKVLEENNIYPDYITGTSMGSIVAGLYSLGYSANQIEEIVVSIDWDNLLSDKIKLREISIIEKHNYPGYPLTITFDKNKKPSLPSGMIDGQKIQALFSKLVWKSNTYKTFDDFPMPYRCVATDIISGKAHIFDKGDLSLAMRASMAIPTVFVPINKDSMLLVDGGVSINYPVQQCIDLGADIVIGSYTGFKEKPKKSELNSMIDILTRSSVIGGIIDAKNQVEKTNLTIFPDMSNFSASDFNKSAAIINEGEKASRDSAVLKKLTEISAIINNPNNKKPYFDTIKIWVDKVVVENNSLIDSKRILRIGKLHNKSYYTSGQVDNAIKKLYSTWQFNKVSYYFSNDSTKNILVIKVHEKSQGVIKIGLHYDNSYGPEALLKTGYSNLFLKSTIAETKLSVSQNPRALLSYKYYPIKNRIFELSVNAYFQLNKVPDIVKDQDVAFQLGHFIYAHSDFNAQLSIAPFRSLLLQAKFGKQLNGIMLRDGMELYYDVNSAIFNIDYYRIKVEVNHLDDNYFPTKGVYINTFLKYTFNATSNRPDSAIILKDVEKENYIFGFKYKQYFLFFKHLSIIPSFDLGTMASTAFITEKFFLGGINYSLRPKTYNFPGIKANYITTDSYIMYGIEGQYKLFKNWYMAAGIHELYFFNYSDFKYDYENEFVDNKVASWNTGLGFRSKFGPIRLILSKNFNKKEIYWSLNLGIPF